MGIMSIRKLAQKFLLPVIIVLVVALTAGLFYIGAPAFRDGNGGLVYKGPSIKLYGKKLADKEYQNLLNQVAAGMQYMSQGVGMAGFIRERAVGIAVGNMAVEHEMEKVKSHLKVSNAEVNKLLKSLYPTQEEVQNQLVQRGLTSKDDLRKELRKQLEQQKFLLYKAQEMKFKVTKAEVEARLKQVGISGILVAQTDPTGKPIRDAAAAQKRAEAAYAKVMAGEAFEKVVAEYSDDPNTKAKKGFINTFPLDEFEKIVVSSDPNYQFDKGSLQAEQVLKPLKTNWGYFIFRIDSIITPEKKEYQEKYDKAEEELLITKFQSSKEFSDWISKIVKKANEEVEILDPALRAYRLKEKEKWTEAAAAYQKAIKKKYYKNKLDIYQDLATVYTKLKKLAEAIAILQKVPTSLQEGEDYKIALAKAHFENKNNAETKKILKALSQDNPDNISLHQRLKAVYEELKFTKEAQAEANIITAIEKKNAEAAKKYEEELKQKEAAAAASPTPSAETTAKPTATAGNQ